MMENKMEERNWKYKITSNWTAVIAVAITTVVSGGFTFWLYTDTMVPLLDSAA